MNVELNPFQLTFLNLGLILAGLALFFLSFKLQTEPALLFFPALMSVESKEI
jgi:di/tricarboxylate transporter